MKTELHTDWTVGDICKGFVYNKAEGKGLFGMDGKLVIQPEYQRNYIYETGGRDAAVVETLLKELPIGLLWFVRNAAGMLEILDGQQRVTSFARYVTEGSWGFSVSWGGVEYIFSSLPGNLQERILRTPLTVYVCEGEPSEIQEWFRTINTANLPLTEQELRNAAFHGEFVNDARKVFSNTKSDHMDKWLTYVKGDPKRQEVLEVALDWTTWNREEKTGKRISAFMSEHRHDAEAAAMLQTRFESIIDWIDGLFDWTGKEIRGLEWGRLHRLYSDTAYSRDALNARVEELMGDPQVGNKRGVFEYVLSGETKPELLNVRVFDEKTKAAVYAEQTKDAKEHRHSNCPICAASNGPNANRIWSLKEMDADHITAWSKGGSSDISNCQMLCRVHNQAKGNK